VPQRLCRLNTSEAASAGGPYEQSAKSVRGSPACSVLLYNWLAAVRVAPVKRLAPTGPLRRCRVYSDGSGRLGRMNHDNFHSTRHELLDDLEPLAREEAQLDSRDTSAVDDSAAGCRPSASVSSRSSGRAAGGTTATDHLHEDRPRHLSARCARRAPADTRPACCLNHVRSAHCGISRGERSAAAVSTLRGSSLSAGTLRHRKEFCPRGSPGCMLR